jgi:hypothetical protein
MWFLLLNMGTSSPFYHSNNNKFQMKPLSSGSIPDKGIFTSDPSRVCRGGLKTEEYKKQSSLLGTQIVSAKHM